MAFAQDWKWRYIMVTYKKKKRRDQTIVPSTTAICQIVYEEVCSQVLSKYTY